MSNNSHNQDDDDEYKRLQDYFLKQFGNISEDDAVANSKSHLVLVYGSLKQGFGNSYCLSDSKFLCGTRTAHKDYNMVSLSAFPAVLETEKDKGFHIVGELYEIDSETLMMLDQLEGNGYVYLRKLVQIADGRSAWMYIFLDRYPYLSADKRVMTNIDKGTQTWMLSSY